ncbi:hypothetical protein AVEN_101198-1 [Araneus ventricosus]|uniref:Uncharacterized protein n=1 Tax=Araneus ventricosus TaxID=182803 RepID=A0A4Y2K7R3_ARAVE|nr:hypothetical protein AVEN_101198-1 [Araneus ventricosus]
MPVFQTTSTSTLQLRRYSPTRVDTPVSALRFLILHAKRADCRAPFSPVYQSQKIGELSGYRVQYPDSNFSLQQACHKFVMTRVQVHHKFVMTRVQVHHKFVMTRVQACSKRAAS